MPLTLNPGVPQPGAFPDVMSVNPSPFNAYMSGFRKPSEDFPAAIRASFSRATKPAIVGDDADVPPMCLAPPPTNILKNSACAETSGNACHKPTKAVTYWAQNTRNGKFIRVLNH